MSLQAPTFALPARLVDRIGTGLRALGLPILEFDPEGVLADACKRTGLSDFGEAGFRTGLERLCQSLDEDANLSFLGRIGLRNNLVVAAEARLRRIEAFRAAPSLRDQALRPPFVVVGLPRSGTTLLHRLLCLGPQARPLLLWELFAGVPHEGWEEHRARCQQDLSNLKRAVPGIDAKHFVAVDAPEECMMLLDSTFTSAAFWAMAPVHGYLRWYFEQEHDGPYRAWRQHLQAFQALDPEARLTLKAPAHTATLGSLLEAAPEAMIVQTHRDPAVALPSLNSLIFSLHSLVGAKVDLERLAESNARWLEFMIAGNRRARERVGSDRIVDVRYEDLVADPVGVVRRIHAHFDLPFDGAFAERLQARVTDRPQGKYGRHEYSNADFGSSDEAVRAGFAGYIEDFVA